MSRAAIVLSGLVVATVAWADPPPAPTAPPAVVPAVVPAAAIAPAAPLAVSGPMPGPVAHPHAIYVELFGKGGLWGVGYDWQPTPRLAIGGAVSWYVLHGDQYATVSPYAAAYPWIAGPHRAFVQVGPQWVDHRTPSPVPEWQGMNSSAFGAEVSVGYEHRAALLARAYVMASIGEHLAPWIGGSLGWTL